jgi:hypothetical protein
VQSKDVVSTGFIESDSSRVEVQVLYDELAVLEEDANLDITRITREAQAHTPYALNLMRISVDGKTLHDPYKNVEDLQRCTDVALEEARIQFKFDSLNIKPRLNVTGWPRTIRYLDDSETETPENRVQFRTYNNYPGFIEKAEIRLFEEDKSTRDEPLAVIPVDANGHAEWLAEFESFDAPLKKLKYLLRVYDSKGNFDETSGLPLWVVDRLEPVEQQQQGEGNETADNTVGVEQELLVGYGENHLAFNNIPLHGGTVFVTGKHIPENHSVWLAGRPVPVNADGEFVNEQIFPGGFHTIEVAVLDQQGNGELFLRELELAKSDWFYVGVADITIAKDNTNGPAELVTGDQTHYDNDLNIDGRLAYFVNGKFGDDWELTSSADTREGPIDDLFSNFLDKSQDYIFVLLVVV